MNTIRVIWSKFSKPIVVLAIVVLAGLAFYFYQQYQALSSPNRQAREFAAKIARFYDLPNEDPTMATITDKNKLSNESFFNNAENGDVVLIFAKAGKAILYRPSTGKIVNVAPVQAASIPPAAATSGTPSKK